MGEEIFSAPSIPGTPAYTSLITRHLTFSSTNLRCAALYLLSAILIGKMLLVSACYHHIKSKVQLTLI